MHKKRANRIKKTCISFLVALVVLAPIDFASFSHIVTHAEDDSNEFIDADTVWSGEHIVDKNVFIDSGATLTIEKGSRILFKNFESGFPLIQVSSGKIIAEGTIDQKITFASLDQNNDTYTIYFDLYDDQDSSVFRWVNFEGNGQTFYSGGVAMKKTNGLFSTAKAEGNMPSQIGIKKGKVHIENSTFSNFADFPVKAEFSINNDSKDKLEIVNSNFKDFALDSEIRCNSVETTSCKEHILLKDNWYGTDKGPDVYSGSWNPELGARIQGKFVLDGWRKSDLIVDPVILVPGIMGSAEVLGKWKLDPILHVYDNLVGSFEKNGFVEGENFFPFPYNWRKSNTETANYLKAAINVVKNQTKISKVDVVAHSMGGLVTRAYIEGDNFENDVDKFITLATPQKGSPKDYLYWEAGEGFFSMADKISKRHFEQEAEHEGYDNLQKYIQEKVISVKELLPDYSYLEDASSAMLRSYPNNYPRNVFLENLNSSNNVEKLKSVNYTNIYGNLDSDSSTISKIRLVNSSVDGKWENGMPEDFYNSEKALIFDKGDETVPTYSAKTIPSDKVVEVNSSHQDIPTKAQCLVITELTGKENCDFQDKAGVPNILLLDVFSPIDIQVISPNGKKIGKDFESDKVINEIDGAYYTGFDTENEFVTIPNPENGEYKILAEGTGNGEYRIEASKISQGEGQAMATESSTILNGVAQAGVKKEKQITVSVQGVMQNNQQLPPSDPPAADPPQTPVDNPVAPPVVTPAPQPAPAPAPVVSQNSSSRGGSHHKHKSKKHKKKKKKSLATTIKRTLGVSNNKCLNKKTLACKTTTYFSKAAKTVSKKANVVVKNTNNFFSTVKNYSTNIWSNLFKKR